MKRNLTLLTDLYQLTMMYGYYREGMSRNISVFDLFFRKTTGESAYAVFAGLEQVIDYIRYLNFTQEDIAYLDSLKLFDQDFLEMLKDFRFTGEIYSMPEGTVVFPNEPLVRVKAPILESQLIETTLLNIINHQTLIATKASRVVHAAEGDPVLEFGLRRAQGPDAGIYGARASIIGGCTSTSNVLAGQMFDIAVSGTHAHSWVMSFPTELEAFQAYARHFPDACLLLVDTYDTLKSGVPNAIKVFHELIDGGHKPIGIRLDSGDLAYLSKKARKMLDEAGLQGVRIVASNDLDEQLIRDLKSQKAAIDTWGVGTQLITGGSNPALGGVYKLAAEVVDGEMVPKMKLSETLQKTTNPGYKKVFRLYNRSNHKAIADLIALNDDKINESKPLRIFHPVETWKSMIVENFTVRELLIPVFIEGKQVYHSPNIHEIQKYAKEDLATMWAEYKRALNPSVYKVDLSDRLYDLRQKLILELSCKKKK